MHLSVQRLVPYIQSGETAQHNNANMTRSDTFVRHKRHFLLHVTSAIGQQCLPSNGFFCFVYTRVTESILEQLLLPTNSSSKPNSFTPITMHNFLKQSNEIIH